MYKKLLATLACAGSVVCFAQIPSTPSPIFTNPRIFSSSNHLLDVLLIARPETIQMGTFHPTAWIYEVCETAVAIADQCPTDSRVISPGGVIFAVQQGDHLRMRLVNHLPPAPEDAENAHGDDPMMNAMSRRQSYKHPHARSDCGAAQGRRFRPHVWGLCVCAGISGGKAPTDGGPGHGRDGSADSIRHLYSDKPSLGAVLLPSSRTWAW